jgi:hypothetical protein
LKLELFDYQEAAAAVVLGHLIKAARDHFDDPADLTAVVLAVLPGDFNIPDWLCPTRFC